MSTPGRADLARTLRQLVDTSELSAAEVGRRVGVSEATISRYLRNKSLPTPAAVGKIVAATGLAGTGDAEAVTQLAEDLRGGAASRVVLLRPGTVTYQRRFSEMESASAHVRTFTPLVTPGLLQTERYARVIFGSNGRAPADIDAQVRARVEERQGRLAAPDHQFTQVMTEGALRWNLGGPAVMVEQLERIAAAARLDTEGRVEVGIIPSSVAAEVLPMTNFDIHDEALVIIGTGFGTAFLDRPHDVAFYLDQFERLHTLAVFGEEAAVEAERIAVDYRSLLG